MIIFESLVVVTVVPWAGSWELGDAVIVVLLLAVIVVLLLVEGVAYSPVFTCTIVFSIRTDAFGKRLPTSHYHHRMPPGLNKCFAYVCGNT